MNLRLTEDSEDSEEEYSDFSSISESSSHRPLEREKTKNDTDVEGIYCNSIDHDSEKKGQDQKSKRNLTESKLPLFQFIVEEANSTDLDPSSKSKRGKTKFSLERLNKLSRPRGYKDHKEEQLHRKISKNACREFIERQEAKEKSRRMKQKLRIEELQYESNLNKKRCPRCGTVQTYDELASNRNECHNDGTTYKPQKTFNLKKFENRAIESCTSRQPYMKRR